MFDRHLQVSIYIDQAWSILIIWCMRTIGCDSMLMWSTDSILISILWLILITNVWAVEHEECSKNVDYVTYSLEWDRAYTQSNTSTPLHRGELPDTTSEHDRAIIWNSRETCTEKKEPQQQILRSNADNWTLTLMLQYFTLRPQGFLYLGRVLSFITLPKEALWMQGEIL